MLVSYVSEDYFGDALKISYDEFLKAKFDETEMDSLCAAVSGFCSANNAKYYQVSDDYERILAFFKPEGFIYFYIQIPINTMENECIISVVNGEESIEVRTLINSQPMFINRFIKTRHNTIVDLNSFKNVYISSDTHFGHNKIALYCDRHYAWNDDSSIIKMNEDILSSYDKLPDSEDTLIIHLGDFAFGNICKEDIKKYVSRIRGNNRTLLFVIGNHDREVYENLKCNEDIITFYKELGFDNVFDEPFIFSNNIVLSHEPYYFEPGFSCFNIHGHTHQCNVTKDYFTIDIENYDIKFIAATKDNMKNIPKPNIIDEDKIVKPERYINVCLDANNMQILDYKEIIKKYNIKEMTKF